MATYFDGFDSFGDLPHEYVQDLTEDELVYAGYSCEDYDGTAIVVYQRDGVWFENHDGHCSCDPLGSWSPERTKVEVLVAYTCWPGLADAVMAREADMVRTRELTTAGPRAIVFGALRA